MNERLQLILACIRVGRANVLTTRDIAKMTNLSVRKVRGGIAELRLNYSVPIVAVVRFLAGIISRKTMMSIQRGSCSTRSRSILSRNY